MMTWMNQPTIMYRSSCKAAKLYVLFSLSFQEPPGPLHGVIIAVSKKLSAQQSEYNNTAAKLGADYRWTYDSSCTHFIFQVT